MWKQWFAKRKLRKFMRQHDMVIEGYGGLNIRGLVVHEFGYLLRYYSGGGVDSFDDLAAVAGVAPQIEGAINQELAVGQLREQQALNVSKATAEANVRNLIQVLHVIVEYIAECKKLGLPANANV